MWASPTRPAIPSCWCTFQASAVVESSSDRAAANPAARPATIARHPSIELLFAESESSAYVLPLRSLATDTHLTPTRVNSLIRVNGAKDHLKHRIQNHFILGFR